MITIKTEFNAGYQSGLCHDEYLIQNEWLALENVDTAKKHSTYTGNFIRAYWEGYYIALIELGVIAE